MLDQPTIEQLVDGVREDLARNPGELTAHRVAEALRATGHPVGDSTVLAVHEVLRRDIIGAGPLEPLLRTPGVTDVLVNGAQLVCIDRGYGLERTEINFPDDASVRRLAQRLAAMAGRRLDDAAPYADLRLPDGTRFHAVLAPLSRPGTSISLRVPRTAVMTMADLVGSEAVSASGAQLLREVISSRLAFLISGGTGSGKTTLLNSLLSLVPATERLVLVEDASELRPEHPHVIGLEARPPNLEGAGAITVRDLVRQALRMRPDRVVVGEVRGGEVVDLMSALNTGHEGGAGTIHANSAEDVPARVESLALSSGLTRQAVHSQLASALDCVLHVGKDRYGQRRLEQVAVLESGDESVRIRPAVTFLPDGSVRTGPGEAALAARIGCA